MQARRVGKRRKTFENQPRNSNVRNPYQAVQRWPSTRPRELGVLDSILVRILRFMNGR